MYVCGVIISVSKEIKVNVHRMYVPCAIKWIGKICKHTVIMNLDLLANSLIDQREQATRLSYRDQADYLTHTSID